MVDSYGGDVWVEDNDPEGAVFVIELPLEERSNTARDPIPELFSVR